MQITIDPTSLESTASVLRSTAEVLADLCPRVAHVADDVWAPPGVAAHLEAVAAGAASTLHGLVYELLDEAADLERRAACCCAGETTSLPLPALVGLAFGGAALGSGSPVQPPSAVSAVAASGPGVAPPVPVFTPSPVTVVPAAAAPAAAQPMSIYEALGSGSFGGGSPVGSGISMVYDPTVNPSRPAMGVNMVFDPTAPRPVPAGMARVPLRSGGSVMDTVLHQQAVLMPWGLHGTLLGNAMGNYS